MLGHAGEGQWSDSKASWGGNEVSAGLLRASRKEVTVILLRFPEPRSSQVMFTGMITSMRSAQFFPIQVVERAAHRSSQHLGREGPCSAR